MDICAVKLEGIAAQASTFKILRNLNEIMDLARCPRVSILGYQQIHSFYGTDPSMSGSAGVAASGMVGGLGSSGGPGSGMGSTPH